MMNNFKTFKRMKKTVFLISIMGLLWAACLHAQELIPYRKGDKWGFCTPDKKIVITPKYDDAGGFIEGLAKVYLDGKCGFIDKTGKEIIPPKYDDAEDFHKVLLRCYSMANGASLIRPTK